MGPPVDDGVLDGTALCFFLFFDWEHHIFSGPGVALCSPSCAAPSCPVCRFFGCHRLRVPSSLSLVLRSQLLALLALEDSPILYKTKFYEIVDSE